MRQWTISSHIKINFSCITLTVFDNHNMSEEIRVSIAIIKISNVNMYILCDLKGQCLNHDHVAHVYCILYMSIWERSVQNFDSLCVQSSR